MCATSVKSTLILVVNEKLVAERLEEASMARVSVHALMTVIVTVYELTVSTPPEMISKNVISGINDPYVMGAVRSHSDNELANTPSQ